MSGDRFGEAWQEYHCADCHPDTWDEEKGEEFKFDKPYVLLVPEGETVPDFCPRCESYLGLCDGAKGLRITNTPAERWIAERDTA